MAALRIDLHAQHVIVPILTLGENWFGQNVPARIDIYVNLKVYDWSHELISFQYLLRLIKK